jgi:isopentenyl phosphate kinase
VIAFYALRTIGVLDLLGGSATISKMTQPNDLKAKLQFVKLGGSLITDKNTPRTARRDVITRSAAEIKHAYVELGDFRLVFGHGSGSFGHVPAKKYGTRQGVDTPESWRGFAEVGYEAALLNHIVMDALHEVGLPAVVFPPSAGIIARDGQVASWEMRGLKAALDAGLIPVVYGDVIFDQVKGGTIFSTEDVFAYLAAQLHPARILLAGIDEGVFADFPVCNHLIPEITPENWVTAASALGGSAATDVTGGMRGKVYSMLDLVQEIPGLEISIFNGNQPGNLAAALQGQSLGTRIINNRREH